jgi:GNAT superfamily N-acetyltransferase
MMSKILQDLSTRAMSRAIRNNLYAFFRNLRNCEHVVFEEEKQLIRWHSDVHHPWFNGVLVTQPPAANEAQTIQEAISFFRSYDVPLFTWWIDSGLETTAWEQQLLANGFGNSLDTPGMAADLYALNENVSVPPQFSVIPVQDWEMLRTWADVFMVGFGLPEAWRADFYTLTADLGLDLPIRNYLGYLGDRPVATAVLFLAAGVAGVYSVSTVPEARRKGIGAAMTLAALRDAREMGYRIGILQSSLLGFHVYERLGFRHLCNLDNFYWKER